MKLNFSNFNLLLGKKEKLSFFLLIFSTLIGLLMEVMGIAIVIPLISYTISSKNSMILGLDFDSYSASLGFSNTLFFLLFLLIFIFLVKMIYFIWLYFFQKSFVSKLINKISDNLFRIYIDQKLSFYSNTNKSSIIQNLQNETYYLFLFFESFLTLITDSLLIILFIVFILIYNAQGFFVLLLYFGLSFIIYLFLTKKKSSEWGEKRLHLDDLISKKILETFGYIKQILINDNKDFFIGSFLRKNRLKYRVISYRLTLDQLPKVYFEFITIIFLVFYISVLKWNDEPIDTIILKLGVLIAISYKIMPGLSKISASYQTIKNTNSSLEIIINELRKENFDKRNHIKKFKNKIELTNLRFKHDEKSKSTLNFENLTIIKNEVIGIYGESGKGKTTILDIISGLYNEFNGDIFIDDKKINSTSEVWKPNVSYVSQDTFIFNDTIKNNIIISRAGRNFNKKNFNDSLKKAQLADWIETLKKNENTIISHEGSNISGGQKQRIGIARAIYKDSDIIILDEPTSSLDKKTENEIFNTIKGLKGDKTIIIVSHNKMALNFCDKIIEIK